MAKSNNQRGGGSSKVRLVVFEAEVSDGDLSQFTQAIQNALQPRGSQPRVITVQQQRALSNEADAENEIISDDGDDIEQEISASSTPRNPRQSKPRAIRPPKVLDGMDWDTKPSLASFVEQYDIKTDFERYLAVALWFREHRETPAISTRHVYTAFRQLN